jgi:thioredoxin 1
MGIAYKNGSFKGAPRMKRINLTIFVAFLALLLINGACGSNSSRAEQKEAAPQKAQGAAEGTVLVTYNLDIDFSKHLVTFIELGADKCIPCKAMQPIMKEIAAEYSGKVQVVFYDVWKDPEPARKYGIQLIPTQVFMDKNGKEIFRHIGLFPKAEIVEFLKKQGIN